MTDQLTIDGVRVYSTALTYTVTKTDFVGGTVTIQYSNPGYSVLQSPIYVSLHTARSAILEVLRQRVLQLQKQDLENQETIAELLDRLRR